MNIALCKCGIDMSEHPHMDPWPDYPTEPIPEGEHAFDAAGTRHRCEELVDGWMCPRPAYHKEHGVPCGPLTGDRLWA
jgi:hypothetical protein